MKLTNKDIKVLEKMKKLCNRIECKDCEFYRQDHFSRYCELQQQPNWWDFEFILRNRGDIE